MSGARLLGLCAVALASAACTRVFDAVTASGPGMVCTQQSQDPDCQPTTWPTADHKANSDPWLVTHNQVITSMSPSVLVLNFDNGQMSTDAMTYAQSVADALGAGSAYHAYLGSSAPVPFLKYTIAKVVQLTDSMTPGTVSAYTPVVPGTVKFDPTALFNDTPLFDGTTFAQHYGYDDGNGGFLSLCDAFKAGKVNEVWIEDGGDDSTTPRAPLYAERKQQYKDNGAKIQGGFAQTIGGFIGATGGTDAVSTLNVPCSVTVRLAHLDPSGSGGKGCDVMVRGWGIEGMWTALPTALAADAYAFLNHDFNTTFGLPGAGWPEICGPASPCLSYQGQEHVLSASAAPFTFDVPNFRQGCGNVLFPPNASQYYDFDNATNKVDSRCAGFGLGGPNGDQYEPYTADQTITNYDAMYTGTSPCMAGWQIYWRQSMPGYQNQATVSVDGSPMPNWWPMLFY
jgi:hypothetical protein